MELLERIARHPRIMADRPCIGGMRVTAGVIPGRLVAGPSQAQILDAGPFLEADDIRPALADAAWRSEESERPLSAG
jgi:uncharacterized protein (DUF433 family)